MVDCHLRNSAASTVWEAFGYGVPGYSPNFMTVAGSAPLAVGSAAPQLRCVSTNNFAISLGGLNIQSRVTFTRVDGLTNGSTTAVKGADSAPAPGAASAR